MSLPHQLYSAKQVQELDRIAIEDFAIPAIHLMQRAGQVTFDAMLARYPDTKTICVLCGVGNNGGDGYVIASLAKQAGIDVNVIQLGNKQAITGDAKTVRQAYLDMSLTNDTKALDLQSATEIIAEADIIIDAIFGTGLSRDVQGEYAKAISLINQSRANTIAVDIPSGLNADTGAVLGCCVEADLTVTYIGLKSGQFTAKASDYVGDVLFDDLGVPYEVYKHVTQYFPLKTRIQADRIKPFISPRARSSHKGNFGHVLCIGGAPNMSGAIRLCAEAALRAGAGLVTVATHPNHAAFLNIGRPEIMVSAVTQADDLIPLLDKATVIVIGPGLGKSSWAQDLLSLVMTSDKPKVLDADALNLLAEHHLQPAIDHHSANTSIGKINAAMHNEVPKLDDNWVLTPHPAEAARLLMTKTPLIEQDRYQAIELLQQRFGGVCVLKGAGSLITNGQETSVCQHGNPGMASGGMGDVLSGIIASLIAQHTSTVDDSSLYDATVAATYLHAKAADLAAENGERGLLASDLFPFIRMLVNESTSQ